MVKGLIYLFMAVAAVSAASAPPIWSGSPIFNSSTPLINLVTATLVSADAGKTGTATVSYGITYANTPKVCYAIYKLASSPTTKFVFDFSLKASLSSATIGYVVGGTTNFTSATTNILFVENSLSTSFLSLGQHTFKATSTTIN